MEVAFEVVSFHVLHFMDLLKKSHCLRAELDEAKLTKL